MRQTKRLAVVGLVLLAACGVAWALLPKPDLYGNTPFSTAVLDRHGQLLRLQLADDQRYRLFTPLEQIAPTFLDATVLYEDRHFYRHPGVNPGALIRAAWTTYVTRDRRMGASTLSMQLARLRFGLKTRTLSGKLQQMGYALMLERHYAKRELLEAYVNLAPYGGNVEGVGTAARIYFDKAAAELTLGESLALAVVPQNPAMRAPTRHTKLPALYAARARLLDRWDDRFPVSATQRQLMQLPMQVRPTRQLPFHAPHLAQFRLNQSGISGRTDTTTLDFALQTAVEHRLTRYLTRRQREGLSNASAMIVDTRTMQILASVGSADFFDPRIHGQVDGTRAKRSPGSTLKPFVYALAMDQGLIHPKSLLSDAPKRFGVYTPENFDRGFMGPVLASDALVYSRNVPAIDLLNRVGQSTFHDFLVNAEVAHLKAADHYGLAMVLGGNELTMRELIQLYAMLANGGVWQEVQDSLHNRPGSARRLLSPEASFLTLDMLRQHRRPDALSLALAGDNPPVAWKTGTSYAFRDAWTVGVTGPYAIAVWVGHFDGRSNPALVGRQAAAPLFFELVDTLLASSLVDNAVDQRALNTAHLPAPALNVKQVPMCAGTGDLPNRDCPSTEPGWFIPGVSPIKVSNIHRNVRIETETGLRACASSNGPVSQALYEFWPSNFSRLFRQAGIATRKPPPYSAHCADQNNRVRGVAPVITSPAQRLAYQLTLGNPQPIPLMATVDADVTMLYWFVDNRFVGRVPPDEALMWSPTVGTFDIQVVDDLGRSTLGQYVVEPVNQALTHQPQNKAQTRLVAAQTQTRMH